MTDQTNVPPWRGVFLRALAESGNVTRSASVAGVNESQVYRIRKRDGEFRAALEVARAAGQAWVASGAGVPGPDEVVRATRAGLCVCRTAWNRWSPQRRETFLITLAATGNVSRAAAMCKMSPAAVYKRRKAEPDFARDWEAALAAAGPRLRDHLTAAAIAVWDPEQTPIPDLPPVSFAEGLKLAQWIEARAAKAGTEPASWETVDVEALRAEVLRRIAVMAGDIPIASL